MALTRGSANKATHSFIPLKFSKKVTAILDNVCAFFDCVNTDWEEDIIDCGDIVSIREFGDITINPYTVDNTITNQTVTESSQDLVIDQQDYFSFKVDDIDVHQTDLNLFDGYEERAAIGMQDKINGFLETGISGAVPAGNTLGAATVGSVIQLDPDNIYDVCVDLYEKLESAKVFGATNQRPWLVVPPKVKAVMKKSKLLTEGSDAGHQFVRNGTIGEFAEFEVKCDTTMTLTAATGGNDDYYQILAGTNLGYTFAMQISKIEPIRLETTFADVIRGLFVYGGEGVVEEALAKAFVKV